MSASCIIDYFQNQNERIIEFVPQLSPYVPIDPVHDIRVSIKRIRSAFRFFTYQSNGGFDSKKEFTSYKKLFKQLATIRDVQIQIQLVRQCQRKINSPLPYYLGFLNEIKLLERRKVKAKVKLLSTGRMSANYNQKENSIKATVKGAIKEPLIRYIRNKGIYLVEAGHDLSNDNSIHATRIMLKELHYLLELHIHCFKGRRSEFEERLRHFKILENALGDWHDREVALHYYHEFETAADGRRIRNKIYQLLKKEIRTEKIIFKKTIIKGFQSADFLF